MTAGPPVSIVIVSRRRPAELRRCLAAIRHVDHPDFEVVVVADPAGLEAAAGEPVRRVGFDVANISAARNLGIAHAAGAVVAFTDDDAVPEPLWLARLTAVFADPAVAAAGGTILSRNGFDAEWSGGVVDRHLAEWSFARGDRAPAPGPGHAVEIKGANCAYRREVLVAAGGFDPALAFHLDETELNLRLAALGHRAVFVPGARVHHLKAASATRRSDRTPLDLTLVGASTAVTLRRLGGDGPALDAARSSLTAARRRQLLAMMVSGRLEPPAVGRLLAQLADGFDEGRTRTLPPVAPLSATVTGTFLRYPSAARPPIELAARPWAARRMLVRGRALALDGTPVRAFVFSPTALFHRRSFAQGVWLQTGGLFGRSRRDDPLFRLFRFGARLARESALGRDGFRNT